MTDSDPRPGTDAEWENLLHQWRSQSEAQPRPYFYQRVRARLVEEQPPRRLVVPAWLRRPAYAVLLGLLGVALSGDSLPAARTVAPLQAQPGSQPPLAPAR